MSVLTQYRHCFFMSRCWSVIKVPAWENNKSSKDHFLFFIGKYIKTINGTSCDIMVTKYTVHEQATLRQLLLSVSPAAVSIPIYGHPSSADIAVHLILYCSQLYLHTPMSDREEQVCRYLH